MDLQTDNQKNVDQEEEVKETSDFDSGSSQSNEAYEKSHSRDSSDIDNDLLVCIDTEDVQ